VSKAPPSHPHEERPPAPRPAYGQITPGPGSPSPGRSPRKRRPQKALVATCQDEDTAPPPGRQARQNRSANLSRPADGLGSRRRAGRAALRATLWFFSVRAIG